MNIITIVTRYIINFDDDDLCSGCASQTNPKYNKQGVPTQTMYEF